MDRDTAKQILDELYQERYSSTGADNDVVRALDIAVEVFSQPADSMFTEEIEQICADMTAQQEDAS